MGKLPISGARLWRQWSKADDKLLELAIKEGASLAMACAALKRTPNAIKRRMAVRETAWLRGRRVRRFLGGFPSRWLADFEAVTARMDRSTYPGESRKWRALASMRKEGAKK